MRISKGEGKNVASWRKLYASLVSSAPSPQRSVLKYHPYHKYSSISIPITSTAMKGFSSRMNTKTFGEVDVISQPVYIRAPRSLRIYHRVILGNRRNGSACFMYNIYFVTCWPIYYNTIFIIAYELIIWWYCFLVFDIIDKVSSTIGFRLYLGDL